MSNFDLYDIIPSAVTNISHRSECNPFDVDGKLPVFTAPMACLIDETNYKIFDQANINVIIPRTVNLEKRLEIVKDGYWIAMGLEEFESFINQISTLPTIYKICIDIANGHMSTLLGICEAAKNKFKNSLVLMAGNVANANTYFDYAGVGIDYIRCSIGSGGACATRDFTGVSNNMVCLLKDLRGNKQYLQWHLNEYKVMPKIIADGGMNSIRDIILALAFGADYAMCGKLLVQAKEACGEIIEKSITVDKERLIPATKNQCAKIEVIKTDIWKPGRIYYGMSTERAQREMGNTTIKHSEGKEYWIPIEYELSEFIAHFVDSLKSTMSYVNARTLNELIGKPKVLRHDEIKQRR